MLAIKINTTLKDRCLMELFHAIKVLKECDPRREIIRNEIKRRERLALAMFDEIN
jgi:hypothetical protein